jgi:hypothetical protein
VTEDASGLGVGLAGALQAFAVAVVVPSLAEEKRFNLRVGGADDFHSISIVHVGLSAD